MPVGHGFYTQEDYAYQANGNLASKTGLDYVYSVTRPRAITSLDVGGWPYAVYEYDANGNLATRPGQTFTYDAENRLQTVTANGQTATFSYDGDGNLVKKVATEGTTLYVGPHYEVTVAISSGQVLTTTKYYAFGGQRIAVKQNNMLSYLHGDHLGSTSVTTSNSGATTTGVRYFAFGGQRSGNLVALPTDHAFTGQKLDRGTGLMYYGARYYDSALGIFISPDTIVPEPGNPQSLNRYTYANHSPLTYIDRDGHIAFIPLLIVGVIVASKAIDYGWTAYDAAQSLKVMNDPNAAEADKAAAAANLTLAAAFEAAEPDDFLPIALPLDDLARLGIIGGMKKVGREGAEQTLTGQMHHVLSKKILDALSEHKILRGILDKEDFLTQAADRASHWGYDRWHRAYDTEVVKWLGDHPEASRKKLLEFLQELYSRPDAKKRFPEAADLLKKALEEQP